MEKRNKDYARYNTQRWDEYYENNSGIEYPHEQLVIYVNYIKKGISYPYKPKALELGFGSIADMQFLYRMGYEVFGLEVSENAVLNSLEQCEQYGLKLDVRHWTPPGIPFPDNSFDFFCSSNAIHFNLDQDLILKEVKRVLKDGAFLYASYLAPGHKFVDRSETIGQGLIQFSEDHSVPKMRGMVIRFYEGSLKLMELYSRYFEDVRVTRLEYNILDNPNAYWIVTAQS